MFFQESTPSYATTTLPNYSPWSMPIDPTSLMVVSPPIAFLIQSYQSLAHQVIDLKTSIIQLRSDL